MTDLELDMLLRARDRARDEAALALRLIDWRSIEQARRDSEALRSQFEQARKNLGGLWNMAAAFDTKFLPSLAEQVRANAEFLRTQKAPTSVVRPWALGPPEIYLPRPLKHRYEVEMYPARESPEPPRRRIGYGPWS